MCAWKRDLPEIEGDAKRLRQLFANLLSNASKFTAEKGRILVMAKAVEGRRRHHRHRRYRHRHDP